MEIQPTTPPQKNKLTAFIIVVVVILAVGGYIWYSVTASDEEEEYTRYALGGAKVTEVDLASNPASKFPPGFPEEIPVEDTIIESVRKVYEEFGITRYTMGSISERSFEAIWKDYTEFFESAGYVVKTNDREMGVMEGSRGEKELTVYIAPRDSSLFVTIYYVERN